MAQRYEAAGRSSQVPSYGWSAEEAARHDDHDKLAGNGASPDRGPATPGPQSPTSPSSPAREDAAGAFDAPQAPQRSRDPQAARAAHRSERAGHEALPQRTPHYRDGAEKAERRARVVRGRRRMLWLLLVLTALGVALAYLQFAAWWIVVPPVVLLGGYLVLLREAARADAEARERRERARAAARAQRASEPTRPSRPVPTATAASATDTTGATSATSAAGATGSAHETGSRADIIDLSERVNDQLYDQYADAKLRAVGD